MATPRLPATSPPPPDQQTGEVRLRLESAQAPGQAPGVDATPLEYVFPINPRQFVLAEPARQQVTLTLGGAYQDHFGPGLPTFSLSGTTGWRGHKGHPDGVAAYRALRDFYRQYLARCGSGDPALVRCTLTVAVPEGLGHYRVSLDRFQTSRSVAEPLLFLYELQGTVLELEAGAPLGAALPAPAPAGAAPAAPAGALRAPLDALMQELFAVAPSSPRLLTVTAQDTLLSLAYQVYGRADLADLLAQANGLLLQQPLLAGQTLVAPRERYWLTAPRAVAAAVAAEPPRSTDDLDPGIRV